MVALHGIQKSLDFLNLLCHTHRPEDVPDKTMFVITTDGYENASRRYDYDAVRNMIERQKKRFGWPRRRGV